MHLATSCAVFLAVLLSLSAVARKGRAVVSIGEVKERAARAELKLWAAVMP